MGGGSLEIKLVYLPVLPYLLANMGQTVAEKLRAWGADSLGYRAV